MFSLKNSKFCFKNFCQNRQKNQKNMDTDKKLKQSYASKILNMVPVKIYKKNNSYYISVKEISKKYKFIGVIFNRKIREQNPKLWNNMVACGVL